MTSVEPGVTEVKPHPGVAARPVFPIGVTFPRSCLQPWRSPFQREDYRWRYCRRRPARPSPRPLPSEAAPGPPISRARCVLVEADARPGKHGQGIGRIDWPEFCNRHFLDDLGTGSVLRRRGLRPARAGAGPGIPPASTGRRRSRRFRGAAWPQPESRADHRVFSLFLLPWTSFLKVAGIFGGRGEIDGTDEASVWPVGSELPRRWFTPLPGAGDAGSGRQRTVPRLGRAIRKPSASMTPSRNGSARRVLRRALRSANSWSQIRATRAIQAPRRGRRPECRGAGLDVSVMPGSVPLQAEGRSARKTAIWPRVTGVLGQKLPPPHPAVMPDA